MSQTIPLLDIDVFDQDYSILKHKNLNDIHDEIGQTYRANNLPWVVGFSGGKDSTAALQLVWYALKRLPPEQRTKHVYVVSSDTLVEAPAIALRIDESLQRINEAAKQDGLPITAHKVTPEITESFWVNLIGRGYPAPYQRFRWCTDRMKIKPSNKFILDRVTEHGEVVVILGVRKAESFTRKQVINLHKIEGSRLARHSMLPGAYVYTPIEEFTVKDIWDYLTLFAANPWGMNNEDLAQLYGNAQGECPMVIDTLTPSCGNTRFGCWVCTVVDRDRSMEAMIESGDDWMRPMLEFRDRIMATRNPEVKPDIRNAVRRNGQVMIKDNRLIYGSFTFEFRQQLLRELLTVQNQIQRHKPLMKLIQDEEVHEIRRIWRSEESDWADTLPKIYEEVTGETLDWVQDDTSLFGESEANMLEDLCTQYDTPPKLVKQLLGIEQELFGLRRRHQLYNRIDTTFNRDWRSKEEIEAEVSQQAAEQENFVSEPIV